MSKYVIEIESLKDGANFLFSANPGEHMRFAPGTRANPSVLPVTPEQFKSHAYDIEGHAEGKYGISTPDIQIWVRDVVSGERERLTFAEALAFVESGVPSSEAAVELQAQAEAKAKAAREARAQGGAAGADSFTPVSPLTET